MVKIIAQIITAESAAVGIKAKYGVKKAQVKMMMVPVIIPDNTGVLTPDELLIADRPKEQVIGKVPMKDPTN